MDWTESPKSFMHEALTQRDGVGDLDKVRRVGTRMGFLPSQKRRLRASSPQPHTEVLGVPREPATEHASSHCAGSLALASSLQNGERIMPVASATQSMAFCHGN